LRNTPDNETVIVEYGFTDSSKDDINQLKNNWQSLAEAVVKAIAEYSGVTYNKPNANNTYTVVKGDSLWSIAKKYNTTVDNIKKNNKLNSNLLKIGQKLILPNNNEYIVQKGDSLWKIANKNNTTIDKLKTLNNLKSDVLQIGQKLIIK
jgi:LysM repeat protein